MLKWFYNKFKNKRVIYKKPFTYKLEGITNRVCDITLTEPNNIIRCYLTKTKWGGVEVYLPTGNVVITGIEVLVDGGLRFLPFDIIKKIEVCIQEDSAIFKLENNL
jgi:hypothetical protein